MGKGDGSAAATYAVACDRLPLLPVWWFGGRRVRERGCRLQWHKPAALTLEPRRQQLGGATDWPGRRTIKRAVDPPSGSQAVWGAGSVGA